MTTIQYECPNNCQKYSKTIDEIFEAGIKHRDKLISLKEISENQKMKISILREEKNGLLDQVDKLELNSKYDSDLILRMTRESRNLKIETRDLKQYVVEMEDIRNDQTEKNENLVTLRKRNTDLEEEIFQKDLKILELSENIDNKQHEGSSLAEELNQARFDNTKDKIKTLEQELKDLKEKEVEKIQLRNEQFYKMETILETNSRMISTLTLQLQRNQEFPAVKCWFGVKCYRKFCRFDHRHVYRKDNRVPVSKQNSADISNHVVQKSLCERCGKVFENETSYKKHIENGHKEKNEEKAFKCEVCSFHFDSMSDLNSHVSQKHQNMEIECELCGKYFVSRNELLYHRMQHDEESRKNEKEIDALTKSLQKLINTKFIEMESHPELCHQCNHCAEGFLTQEGMIKHMKTTHETTKEKPQKIIPSSFKCELCEINFNEVNHQHEHMDEKHGGRWKYGDKDIIYEGDEYEETDSCSDDTSTENSDTEASEIQSGEVSE